VSDGTANKSRRRFLIGATTAVSAVGGVGAAVPFVGSWNPSAKALAAGAPITIDISRLEPGELLGPMPAWRGQPVFVMRRDETTLSNLKEHTAHLADPASEKPDQQPDYAQNEFRSRKPELMVLVGICTHLGCSPQLLPKSSRRISMRIGGAAFSAPATDPSSTSRGASTPAYLRRTICGYRHTTS